jgi:hypothetical protein
MTEAQSLPSLYWQEREFSFSLRALTADNACLQKMLGNLGGSAHLRCTCCAIDFSCRTQLWQWQTIEKAKRKSILTLACAWAEGTATTMGMKVQSPFVPSLESLNLNPALKEWAKKLIIGTDPLHNIKGHWASILARLRGAKHIFDYNKFSNLVDQHIQRRLASELDGAHMRELAVRWNQVLMPALLVSETEQPIWREFFIYWTEVGTSLLFKIPTHFMQ